MVMVMVVIITVVVVTIRYALDQGSATFFLKGTDSRCFRLCKPDGISRNYSHP